MKIDDHEAAFIEIGPQSGVLYSAFIIDQYEVQVQVDYVIGIMTQWMHSLEMG